MLKSAWDCASPDCACATSVRVTSPTLKRSCVARKLFRQHPHVVLPEVHDGLIADHIHVGGRGVEKNALLGVAEILTARLDQSFRALDVIIGAEAVENILLKCDLRLPRIGFAVACGTGAVGERTQRQGRRDARGAGAVGINSVGA